MLIVRGLWVAYGALTITTGVVNLITGRQFFARHHKQPKYVRRIGAFLCAIGPIPVLIGVAIKDGDLVLMTAVLPVCVIAALLGARVVKRRGVL